MFLLIILLWICLNYKGYSQIHAVSKQHTLLSLQAFMSNPSWKGEKKSKQRANTFQKEHEQMQSLLASFNTRKTNLWSE